MAYEIEAGKGKAFKNEKYVAGGTQPYARGKFKTPDGVEYEIALWIPKSNNVKGFNLTVKEPYTGNNQQSAEYYKQKQSEQPAQQKRSSYDLPSNYDVREEGSEDDLPF